MKVDKLVIILGAALFLSLSVNLFVAGLMVGQSVESRDDKKDPDADPKKAEWQKRDAQLREKLSSPDRDILEAARKENHDKIEGLRNALDDAHSKVEEAQNAEPFDQQAFDAAVSAEAAKKAELLKTVRALRQEVMQKMSPEGRAEMQKLKPLNQKPGGRMGGGGMGGGRWRDRPEGPGGPEGDGPQGGPPPKPPGDDYGQSPPPPPENGANNGQNPFSGTSGQPAQPPKPCGGCEVPNPDGGGNPPAPSPQP